MACGDVVYPRGERKKKRESWKKKTIHSVGRTDGLSPSHSRLCAKKDGGTLGRRPIERKNEQKPRNLRSRFGSRDRTTFPEKIESCVLASRQFHGLLGSFKLQISSLRGMSPACNFRSAERTSINCKTLQGPGTVEKKVSYFPPFFRAA